LTQLPGTIREVAHFDHLGGHEPADWRNTGSGGRKKKGGEGASPDNAGAKAQRSAEKGGGIGGNKGLSLASTSEGLIEFMKLKKSGKGSRVVVSRKDDRRQKV